MNNFLAYVSDIDWESLYTSGITRQSLHSTLNCICPPITSVILVKRSRAPSARREVRHSSPVIFISITAKHLDIFALCTYHCTFTAISYELSTCLILTMLKRKIFVILCRIKYRIMHLSFAIQQLKYQSYG